MYLPLPGMVRDNDTPPIGWSIALVAGVAWLVSLPWAVLHGPIGFQWVVSQALGAGIIPAVAGWLSLWRRKGDLRGAVWVTVAAAALLLALEVWSLARA
jgi:hypothetical protein